MQDKHRTVKGKGGSGERKGGWGGVKNITSIILFGVVKCNSKIGWLNFKLVDAYWQRITSRNWIEDPLDDVAPSY